MTARPASVFLALFPFALGYLMSYLLRAVNAVVAPELVKDFGLGPGELGLLTAAYLLAFCAFQLPLGVLLDRFGVGAFPPALLVLLSATLVVVWAARQHGFAAATADTSGAHNLHSSDLTPVLGKSRD